MFIVLILSFFNFLVGPKGNGPDVYVDPTGVMLQLISILGASSLILAGTFFGLTKFIVAGIGIAILGIYLFKKSKNYPNLEDEIH